MAFSTDSLIVEKFMRVDNVIKLAGVLIAYSVFISVRCLSYNIHLITSSQGHPLIIFIGLANILGWVSGVVAALFLLMARPYAQWFLLAYFIFGLVGTTIGWVPLINILYTKIGYPYLEIALTYLTNLAILILVITLFKKQKNARLNGRLRGAR